MGWIIAYLCSVILATFALGIVGTSGGDTLRFERQDLICLCAFIIIWPITLCVIIPILNMIDSYKKAMRQKAERILDNNDVSNNKTARVGIVNMDEKDLKFLMKAFRKGYVELNAAQAENVREELQNRLVEKSILK